MEKALQQKSEGPSAQPSAPNATIVARTTTLRRCVGTKNQRRMPDTKTQYLTHYVRLHRQTRPRTLVVHTLDHHVFDQSTKEWLKRQSQSQPYIRLHVSVDREDHNLLGFPLTAPLKQSFVSRMADTGCQSCLAGINIVKKLVLSTGDLIPVSLRMHAADNHNIHILGATILKLSGKDNKETEMSIKHMTNNTNKLFLSREACIDLGIISHKFPTMNEADETNTDNSVGTTTASPPQQECQCPKRTKPPTSLPYPATEANREKLEQ